MKYITIDKAVFLQRYVIKYKQYDTISDEIVLYEEPVISDEHRDGMLAVLEQQNKAIADRYNAMCPNGSTRRTPKELATWKQEQIEKYQIFDIEVEPIDQAGNEWIDGMEFENPDDISTALEMGAAEFAEFKLQNDPIMQMQVKIDSLLESKR